MLHQSDQKKTCKTHDIHVFPINNQANSSGDICAISLLADRNRL